MTILAWLSIALAGTIRVHAPAPVSVKIDGQWVGRVVTDVTVTDVAAGTHTIEVFDTFGAVLASTQVIVAEDGEPLWFDYYAHRLLPVERQLVPTNAEPISDVAFQWIELRLAKKRKDKKRMKFFLKVVNANWYEMRHVDSLLLGFGSIEYRVQAAQLLAPRTLDPEKTLAIEDHFPPGEFRERAMAAFAAFQRPDVEEE
jgi:hypothetical protein